LFDQPPVHRFTSRIYPAEDRSTMFVATPIVDMIYHQEVLFRLTAARAFESVIGVVTEHRSPKFLSPDVVTVFPQRTIILGLVGNRPLIDQPSLIRVSPFPFFVVGRAYDWVAITTVFLRPTCWLVWFSAAVTGARIRWNALGHYPSLSWIRLWAS